jgi:periplasmic divalent cation tolerance protein
MAIANGDNVGVTLHAPDCIFALCACGSEGEAEEIASQLVALRLAACVNILSPVRSIYRWQGKVESAQEWMLTIKTTADRFEDLSAAIQSLHSYELPEIIAIPITNAFAPYLNWISSSVHV